LAIIWRTVVAHPPFRSGQLALRLLLVVILLIVVATQTPFTYTPVPWSFAGAIQEFFRHPSNRLDLIDNVIMFFPFGFCWTWWSQRRDWKPLHTILIATLLSAGFSLVVETLQLFLPSRFSSIIDIGTNSLGGLLGGLSYWLWPRYYAFLQTESITGETDQQN
jgi:glycopeptide antibiotics resistance protein